MMINPRQGVVPVGGITEIQVAILFDFWFLYNLIFASNVTVNICKWNYIEINQPSLFVTLH